VLWSGLYTARISLTNAAICMNLINESVRHSDITRYFLVIVIFYFANTTAFH